jgi:dimethylargininase
MEVGSSISPTIDGMEVRHALVRPVPATFAQALIREGSRRLNPSLATEQHRTYQQQLSLAGYTLLEVPSDDRCPDCVFIEDAAVIVGSVALVTRPGARSRRPETGPVGAALRPYMPTIAVTAPGTIDGGDVFRSGQTIYVGRSGRTNAEGIEQLRDVAAAQDLKVVTVGIYDTLHLKSAVLPIAEDAIVVTPNSIEEEQLDDLRLFYEAEDERFRFSALPLRDGRLLVTENSPRTGAMLESAGYDIVPIDISELQAADGGLTCLSILF